MDGLSIDRIGMLHDQTQRNSVSLADGGNYALAITTAAGKVTTESQKLVVEDHGALVYKLRGTNSTANASGKESSKLEGYLLRDRTNNYSYLFWLWPTIKGGGGNKTTSSKPEATSPRNPPGLSVAAPACSAPMWERALRPLHRTPRSIPMGRSSLNKLPLLPCRDPMRKWSGFPAPIRSSLSALHSKPSPQ